MKNTKTTVYNIISAYFTHTIERVLYDCSNYDIKRKVIWSLGFQRKLWHSPFQSAPCFYHFSCSESLSRTYVLRNPELKAAFKTFIYLPFIHSDSEEKYWHHPHTKQVTWLVVTEVRSESFGLVTEHRHYNACPIYESLSYVANVIFFIVEHSIVCFLCAMHIFEVQASSSSPRLPLCQI